MRPLDQALSEHELVVLRVIGEWWELDLTGADKADSIQALAARLPQLDLRQEMTYWPPEDTAAFADLIAAAGRMPVATFSRKHGEVRMMGPGRLEREEPWFEPVSPAEALWYRGLLFRGFDETAEGLVEFYYLPPELLSGVTPDAEAPASEREKFDMQPVTGDFHGEEADTDAVDDLTCLLALAQKRSLDPADTSPFSELLLQPEPARISLLVTLALEMGLLRQSKDGMRPTRAAVNWLQEGREAQLRRLADAWSHSGWNELQHTPGLLCEGDGWQNEPILARTALLEGLARSGDWFRLADLVASLKATNPDFQRPDGNYGAWYIRDLATDAYITGFENWDLVEGRLLHYLIQGPMCWLGLVEVATDTGSGTGLFRLSPRMLEWLSDVPPPPDQIQVPIVVQADASVLVPRRSSRYHRFQVARVGEAQSLVAGKPFLYYLTPQSLQLAQEQGITGERLLRFLAEAGGQTVPASVRRAIERWQERGVEGRMETAMVLRVSNAEILETLRTNPRTRPYLGESLGELAVTVRPDDWLRLRQATAQLGLLLDARLDALS